MAKITKILFFFSLGLFTLKAQVKYNPYQYISHQDTLPYQFLSPQIENEDSTLFPLVIFLHGAGERGNNNQIQLTHGADLFTDSINQIKFPSYVLFPQCPKGKRWVEVDWGALNHQMPVQPSWAMTLLIDLIDSIKTHNTYIDTNRIYLMGMSMGGYGTWDLAMRKPNLFAGIVPICGGGDETKINLIKNIPVWLFHGELDTVVKTSRSKNMEKAYISAGVQPKATYYPKVKHNAWTYAFKEKELLNWLFSQRK